MVGGFGVASGKEYSPHSRLSDVVHLQPFGSRWELHRLNSDGICPGKICICMYVSNVKMLYVLFFDWDKWFIDPLKHVM